MRGPDSPVQMQTILGAVRSPILVVSTLACIASTGFLAHSKWAKEEGFMVKAQQRPTPSAPHSPDHQWWSYETQKTKHHLIFPFSPVFWTPLLRERTHCRESPGMQPYNEQSQCSLVPSKQCTRCARYCAKWYKVD